MCLFYHIYVINKIKKLNRRIDTEFTNKLFSLFSSAFLLGSINGRPFLTIGLVMGGSGLCLSSNLSKEPTLVDVVHLETVDEITLSFKQHLTNRTNSLRNSLDKAT
ncbi:hypothetical protein BpHYR1_046319 [Brachionus plicatilis]|uniref:Uncharacterized protein n=1 Tax=Brachionus plicatilis TaxID=10195 RepID=A0A3M7SG29_BRAPC|nr:hypothetical protein BpHYR1_046319 [Brachionus plicatilis]